MSALLPLFSGAVVVLLTEPAQAEKPSGIVSFGYLHSFVSAPQSSAGNGVEGTFVYYDRTMPNGMLGLGGFFHLQNLTPAHLALDIGPQANVGPVGFAVGYGYRGPFADRAGMHGVHAGPFLSVGLASLGLHTVLPIADAGAGQSQGAEVAVTLAFKFFYPVFGEMYNMRLPSGLPLRASSDAGVAAVRSSADWLHTETDVQSASLPPSLRAWLAERWLADALDEHAAIAAFARLSLTLLSAGAPPSLIEATQRAALDEIRHAERCFSLARSYSNSSNGPDALPAALAPVASASLEQIAVACFRDGCLGEGFAAALATAACERAREPSVITALTEIAHDESNHAELAWTIIGWCVEQGGVEVLAALSAARDALPSLVDLVPAPASSLDEAAAHGRLDAVEQMRIFLRVRRAVCERLAGMLGE